MWLNMKMLCLRPHRQEDSLHSQAEPACSKVSAKHSKGTDLADIGEKWQGGEDTLQLKVKMVCLPVENTEGDSLPPSEF